MAVGRSGRTLLAVLVGSLLSLTPPSPALAVPATCGLAAHRGKHKIVTENSTGSIRAALAARVDYIELDVRAAQDGTLFLMHDRSVQRTTNGKGAIANKTRAQVKALRLDDGTRVPTLRQAFKIATDSPVRLLIELKRMGGRSTYRDLVDQVRAFGRKRVRVASFSKERLDMVSALAPRIRLGIITLPALTAEQVAPYDAVLINHRSITSKWLAGMPYPVFVWTPSPPEWGRWVNRVRAVITDHVRAFRRYRADACAT